MLRLKGLRFAGLLALSTMLLTVPTRAQFEVSPDHFDSGNKETPRHKTTKRPVNHTARATARAAGRKTGTSQAAGRNKRTNRGTTSRLAPPRPVDSQTTATLRPR